MKIELVQDSELLDAVFSLENKCFESEAWSMDAINKSYSSPVIKIFIAIENSAIIGYCIYQKIENEAELLRIGVDATYRHQGIGTFLLSQSIEKLNVNNCFLEVKDSNVSAIAIYKKYGFIVYDKRVAYYSDGKDALLMQWKGGHTGEVR